MGVSSLQVKLKALKAQKEAGTLSADGYSAACRAAVASDGDDGEGDGDGAAGVGQTVTLGRPSSRAAVAGALDFGGVVTAGVGGGQRHTQIGGGDVGAGSAVVAVTAPSPSAPVTSLSSQAPSWSSSALPAPARPAAPITLIAALPPPAAAAPPRPHTPPDTVAPPPPPPAAAAAASTTSTASAATTVSFGRLNSTVSSATVSLGNVTETTAVKIWPRQPNADVTSLAGISTTGAGGGVGGSVGGGTASMPRGQSSMAALASLNLGAFKPAAAAPLVELTPAAWTPPLPQGGGSMAPLANLNVSAPRSIAVAPPVQLPPQEANSMAPLAGLNLGAYEPASTAPPILDAAQGVGASAPASVWAPGATPAPVPTSVLIQSTAASGSFPRPSLAAQTAAASRAVPPPPVERGADNPAAAASPPPPRARSTGRDGGLGFSMSDFNNINLSGRRSTGVSKGGGGDGDSGGSSGGGGGDNASQVHTEVHHGHTGGGSGSGSGSRGRERARIALPTDPTLGPVDGVNPGWQSAAPVRVSGDTGNDLAPGVSDSNSRIGGSTSWWGVGAGVGAAGTTGDIGGRVDGGVSGGTAGSEAGGLSRYGGGGGGFGDQEEILSESDYQESGDFGGVPEFMPGVMREEHVREKVGFLTRRFSHRNMLLGVAFVMLVTAFVWVSTATAKHTTTEPF